MNELNELSNTGKIVAYFDFDGTLTTQDTFIPFLIYTVGLMRFFLKLPQLLIILLRYWFKRISNEVAKELTITALIKGYSFKKIDEKALAFARNKLWRYIKPEIYSKLEYHVENEHYIVIVSANLSIYLSYWAKLHYINDVIATEIEFTDNICTGKLKTRNCYGKFKVERIYDYLKKQNKTFNYIYAYGNSRGDYELLSYADEGYWVKGSNIMSWTDYRVSKYMF